MVVQQSTYKCVLFPLSYYIFMLLLLIVLIVLSNPDQSLDYNKALIVSGQHGWYKPLPQDNKNTVLLLSIQFHKPNHARK